MISSNYSDEKNELLSMHSDMYKDAYGFRPRGVNFDKHTIKHINDEIDFLQEIIEDDMKLQAIRQQQDIVAFKNLIQETIEHGAGNHETALRWLLEGSEYPQDIEMFVWSTGIDFTEYGRSITKQIENIFAEC